MLAAVVPGRRAIAYRALLRGMRSIGSFGEAHESVLLVQAAREADALGLTACFGTRMTTSSGVIRSS